MRVALIQNRVQRGGRFQVSVEMLKVLNDLGIVPDFYCYRARIDLDQIKKHYGVYVKVNFKTISEPKLPFEWNIVMFNHQINRHLKGYDLVINSNNTSFGLSPHLNLISYVHFPRKFRMRSPFKSIHLKGIRKSWFDIANDPFGLLGFIYKWDRHISKNDLIIANSHFTAKSITESYDITVNRVIYPSVEVSISTPEKVSNRLVSLGRFSPDKRQLEQIEMMKNLPNHELYLIGFKNNVKYFNKCESCIADLGLSNVKLFPDANQSTRDEILRSSRYFIHTLRNEPFGITTVQGIAAGCIPIVHNSGGQKEVVPMEHLRFNNENDIPTLIEKLEGLDDRSIISNLQDHILQYSATNFRKAFKVVVLDKLKLS